MTQHLAQLNVGRIAAPLESPALADFVNGLDEINALAERSPGFVWRLQTEDGNATALRPYDDDRMLVNLSVWESLDSLSEFVYRTDHVQFLRRRREWFEPLSEAVVVLWWIPAGTIPTVGDAVARLDHLHAHGSSARAFTFRQPFEPAGLRPVEPDDRNRCPA